jgi:hypothetical protein
MFLRQPLVNRGRQKKSGLAVNRAKIAHRNPSSPSENQSADSTHVAVVR